MEIRRLYSKLNQITELEHYSCFSFYLHGGIINWPDKAKDIDIKLVPRIKPITIQMVNKTMKELNCEMGLETVFFKRVGTWGNKFKPTLQEIDSLKPVLQAVYGKNLQELLDFNQEIDKMYLYHNNMRYKQLGNLIFYQSSEWAVCGHKYNQNFKDLPDEIKDKPLNKDHIRLHESGELFKEVAEYRNWADIEIRELLQRPRAKDWQQFKEMYRR